MKAILKKIQPWVGLAVLLILGFFFWETVAEQEPQLHLPSGLKLVLLVFMLPWIVLFKMLVWWSITKGLNISLCVSKTIKACLMSMAGKYIPGKVLFMVGRIQAYGPNKKRLGIASFGMVVEFIVEIMAGALLLLLAGAFGVLPDYATPWLICAGCLFISGAMSNLFFERSFKAKAITKRYGTLPKLNNGLLNHLPLLLTMGHWAVYLGSIAILHPQIHLNLLQWFAVGAALGFSSTIGTLSLITPGGLGVREGLATVLFTHLGLEPHMAFQLAIGARITQWIAELSCAVPVVLWELWLSQKRKTQNA